MSGPRARARASALRGGCTVPSRAAGTEQRVRECACHCSKEGWGVWGGGWGKKKQKLLRHTRKETGTLILNYSVRLFVFWWKTQSADLFRLCMSSPLKQKTVSFNTDLHNYLLFRCNAAQSFFPHKGRYCTLNVTSVALLSE